MRKILQAIPAGVASIAATLLCLYLLLAKNPLGEEQLPLFDGADKVAHFLIFMGVACAYIYDYIKFRLPHHTRVNKELALMTAAIALGGLTETCQLLMQNGRTFEVYDWVADAVGAIAGFLFMRFVFVHPYRNFMLKYRRHHHHHHSERQHSSQHKKSSSE